MRILLYTEDKPGEVVKVLGEYPLEEIGELLGGEASEPVRVSSRLAVVPTVAGMNEGLPSFCDIARRVDRMPEPIYGPFAVVHMAMTGQLGDMTALDVTEAQGMLIPREVTR